MTDAGFKLDWFEKKLDQVKEKKEETRGLFGPVARNGGRA